MFLNSFKRTQFVSTDLNSCWEFFSSPHNLSKITPPSMGFVITSDPEKTMYAGQIIKYTVKPLLGIPMTWVTEITHVEQDRFFVDEQRFGPYKFWHHKHFFESVEGGVEMTDLIHYALPFGCIGQLFHPLIKKQLDAIFSYRNDVITKLFQNKD